MKGWSIYSEELGYFIGEFLGLGFFSSHVEAGECSDEEKIVVFDSVVEAQDYLDSWVGGSVGCYIRPAPDDLQPWKGRKEWK